VSPLSLSAPHSYLLEKSRVVHQQDQERNYHFFYQVVAAAADNPDLAKLLYFTDSDEHFYLSQSSVNVIEGLSDLEQFNEVQSAMEVLGMSAEQQMQVIKIVAGILHLGNISEFPNLSLTLSGLSFPLDISSLVQNSDRQTPQETQQL
jgi:myosin heavy subunit